MLRLRIEIHISARTPATSSIRRLDSTERSLQEHEGCTVGAFSGLTGLICEQSNAYPRIVSFTAAQNAAPQLGSLPRMFSKNIRQPISSAQILPRAATPVVEIRTYIVRKAVLSALLERFSLSFSAHMSKEKLTKHRPGPDLRNRHRTWKSNLSNHNVIPSHLSVLVPSIAAVAV